MNTITLNHKGETISLLTLDRHEQADIAENFDTLGTAFDEIKSIAVSTLNSGSHSHEAALRKIIAIAKDHGDLAGGWEVEYSPK